MQDRNRLFVSVHILLVGVCLCLDLLCELIHEVGEYLVHLLTVSLRTLGSFRLASVFDHTNGSVHLSYPQLGNTQQAQDWKADIELPDRLLMNSDVEDLIGEVLLALEEECGALLQLDLESCH